MNLKEFEADGIQLLAYNGYEAGQYNPHNVRAWVIVNEYGPLGLVIGANESEAIDEAADIGILDSLLMSPEDHLEYESNGWDDSYMLAGNAGEPFWSENLHLFEVART